MAACVATYFAVDLIDGLGCSAGNDGSFFLTAQWQASVDMSNKADAPFPKLFFPPQQLQGFVLSYSIRLNPTQAYQQGHFPISQVHFYRHLQQFYMHQHLHIP